MKYYQKFFAHLKKIIIHKYWVCYYCFKCGLYWQGITHDMSKFSPVEFFESVKYYQGNRSPIDACKEDKGYSMAWFHHKGRNPHHYEHWTDSYDKGTVAIQMPYKYAVELVCDYLGAARAYLGDKFTYSGELDWWVNNKLHVVKMNDHTKSFVTEVFKMLAKDENHVSMLPELKPLSLFNEEYLTELYEWSKTHPIE